MIHAFQDDANAFFVMEFCASNFRDVLKMRRFTLHEIAYFLAEIAEGIEACHTKRILHRDLKPENILVTTTGHLKIGDLGLSLLMSREQHEGSCGTWIYSSPEMLSNKPYGFATDYWSFGVIAFELLTTEHPLGDSATSMKDCLKETRNIDFAKIDDDDARDFVKSLLTQNANRRMGYAQVRKHKFMASIDWDLIQNFGYDPPIIPARNNGNFRSQFEKGPFTFPLFKIAGRKIEGFSYNGFANSQAPENRLINADSQYDLIDLEPEADEFDQQMQMVVDNWIAGQGRFEGKVIVRNEKIYCRIGKCTKQHSPFQVAEDNRFVGFIRHFENHHKQKSPAPSAAKRIKKR